MVAGEGSKARSPRAATGVAASRAPAAAGFDTPIAPTSDKAPLAASSKRTITGTSSSPSMSVPPGAPWSLAASAAETSASVSPAARASASSASTQTFGWPPATDAVVATTSGISDKMRRASSPRRWSVPRSRPVMRSSMGEGVGGPCTIVRTVTCASGSAASRSACSAFWSGPRPRRSRAVTIASAKPRAPS